MTAERFHQTIRRSTVILAILLAPTSCFCGWAQQTSTERPALHEAFTQYVSEGSRALERGDNSTAEKSFRSALALDPNSVPLLNNLAISIARQDRSDEAIALYQRALGLKKEDPVTQRNLGVAYFRAHRYRDALPLLRSFSAADPTFQSLDLTGLDLFALDRYKEAADYLERASHLQPKDLPTLDILGQAYWRAKDRPGVTQVFDRIMSINPESSESHFMMGLAYDLMYQEGDASKEFQAVLAADPNYPAVHSSLGLIDYREHKVPEAEAEFKQELSRNPRDPVSNYMMGQLLRQQEEQAEAVAYLKSAVAENPAFRDALFELGQCYLELKRPSDALEPLRRVIEIDPDYAQAHFVLGKAFAMLGRPEDAKREQVLCRQIQVRQHAATNSPH